MPQVNSRNHLFRAAFLALVAAGILTAQQPSPAVDAAKAQPPQASQAQAKGPKVWIVQKDDTLYSISQKFGIPLGKLMAWNPLPNGRTELWEGDKVYLEAPTGAPEPAKVHVPQGEKPAVASEALLPVKQPKKSKKRASATVATPVETKGPDSAPAKPVEPSAVKNTGMGATPVVGEPTKAAAQASGEPQSAPRKMEPALPEPVKADPEPIMPPAPRKTRQQAPREVRGFAEAADDLVVVRELRDVKEVTYNPDAVPLINCGPTIVTSIYLPDKERIAGSTCGDTVNWLLTPLEGKNAFYLKPKMVGEAYETNLVIICESGNVYNIALTAEPNKRPLKTLRILPPANALFGNEEDSVVFEPGQKVQGSQNGLPGLAGLAGDGRTGRSAKGGLGPADIQALLDAKGAEERNRADRMQEEFMSAMMSQRHDDFNISYDWNCPFRITNIFSASGVTYIRVDVPDNAQPLLWVIDEGGKKAAVNMVPFSKIPGAFMVDRVFLNARVVVGNKEARVHNAALARQIKATKKAS